MYLAVAKTIATLDRSERHRNVRWHTSGQGLQDGGVLDFGGLRRMHGLIGDFQHGVRVRGEDAGDAVDVPLKVHRNVGSAGERDHLDVEAVLRGELEHPRQRAPAVLGPEVELPAHHRQHAHDRHALSRGPCQVLRGQVFLPVRNVVDESECSDPAPLEG